MSIADLYKEKKEDKDSSYSELRQRRSENIFNIKKISRYDVIVAGGGIQGAVFARLAAFNGLKTLLLEINDYSSGTSGRTSKMAHGGLRYLEYFDFRQVIEGVKARENLYKTLPHLVSPNEFLIPIFKGEFIKKLKLKIGLAIYDFFVNKKDYTHRWIKAEEGVPEIFGDKGRKLSGFFKFYDGIMHDVRVVLENVFAARQEGAHCLNHARVDSIYQHHRDIEVSWTDLLSGDKHTVVTGAVVNTAGAWAPALGRISTDKNLPAVRYSQGTHLLFSKVWKDPAILIPLPGKGRNYFIWPHPSGTMVGTTEKELQAAGFEPMPSKEEIDELLSRLKRDVPNSGLSKENLFYSFAGIRTLPSKGGSNQTFRLSRRHIWSYSQGVLSLIGGKFTSAIWTATEGLKMMYKIAGIKKPVIPLGERRLPGAYNLNDEKEIFRNKCRLSSVPDAVTESCLRRLGGRVKVLTELDPGLGLIDGKILKADILFALYYEQAETLEDILSRRLDLEFEKGGGLSYLNSICDFLKTEIPETDWAKQAEIYRARIEKTAALMV